MNLNSKVKINYFQNIKFSKYIKSTFFVINNGIRFLLTFCLGFFTLAEDMTVRSKLSYMNST